MRNPLVEEHLNDLSVPFEYVEDIPLDQFDVKSGLRNQARFEPLDESWVARYAEAVTRGDKFPAIITAQKSNGEHVTLDGNHRYHGHVRAGVETIDSYVVTATPEKLRVISLEANSRHGRPPSEDERKRHAIYMIDNGSSQEAAAAATGLVKKAVGSAWLEEKGNRRARTQGVTRGWANLNKGQRERLAAISTDRGFVAATKFVIDKKVDYATTRALCASLREARSDDVQVRLVEEAAAALVAANTAGESAAPKEDFQNSWRGMIMHLGYIAKVDADAVVNQVITEKQRDQISASIMATRKVLNRIDELLADVPAATPEAV